MKWMPVHIFLHMFIYMYIYIFIFWSRDIVSAPLKDRSIHKKVLTELRLEAMPFFSL